VQKKDRVITALLSLIKISIYPASLFSSGNNRYYFCIIGELKFSSILFLICTLKEVVVIASIFQSEGAVRYHNI